VAPSRTGHPPTHREDLTWPRPPPAHSRAAFKGGCVVDPRTNVEHQAGYDQVYPVDARIVRLAGHLFTGLGAEAHAPDPVGERLAHEPTGSNTVDINPRLIRPNPPGVQWRR
jgi:hypothetical protein